MIRGKPLNIILTAAGCPGWGDIAGALRNNGEREIKLIAVDMLKDTYGYHLAEYYCRVPAGTDPDYIDAMKAVAVEFNADAIVPLADPELPPLAKHKEEFEEMGVVIPLANYSVIESVRNKIELYNLLNKKSSTIPDYRIIDRLSDLAKSARELGYPEKELCFKPGLAHGSRGFRILSERRSNADTIFSEKDENTDKILTLSDAVKLFGKVKEFPPLLMTPVFPGEEYSVDLLIRDGVVLSAVCRLRERVVFGLTGIGKVVNNPKIFEKAKEIARLTGLEFNANIQFKMSDEIEPGLLEINPRTSGTIALCVAAGVNLPYLGLKLALGEKVDPVDPTIGVRSYRYWTQVFTYE